VKLSANAFSKVLTEASQMYSQKMSPSGNAVAEII
jgi:hypothetical protein